MDTKSIAAITTFAAMSIILEPVKIPTFYWLGWYYTLCEIPVVVAFLIYGFRIGVLVEILHIAGQEVFFPAGAGGVVAYPMGLLARALMFVGIYLASKFMTRRAVSGSKFSEKRTTVYLTASASVFRGGLMPLADYGVLYHILLPLALGITIPESYTASLLPFFYVYNVTMTLYVVPISHFLARRVSVYLKKDMRYPI